MMLLGWVSQVARTDSFAAVVLTPSGDVLLAEYIQRNGTRREWLDQFPNSDELVAFTLLMHEFANDPAAQQMFG